MKAPTVISKDCVFTMSKWKMLAFPLPRENKLRYRGEFTVTQFSSSFLPVLTRLKRPNYLSHHDDPLGISSNEG